MKVTKVEGRDEFVKKLADANPQMKTLLSTILNDEQLKLMSEPAFTLVPDRSQEGEEGRQVAADRHHEEMGPIGSYNATYDYTYDAVEKKKTTPTCTRSCSRPLSSTPPRSQGRCRPAFQDQQRQSHSRKPVARSGLMPTWAAWLNRR